MDILPDIDKLPGMYSDWEIRVETRRFGPFTFRHTPFVQFYLEGMRVNINRLHDRVNQIVNVLLFESHVRRWYDEKRLNSRQYTIVSQLLAAGGPVALTEIRRAPWYQALYLKLSDKTRQRDLHQLRDLHLVTVDKHERLWLEFMSAE